MISVLLGFSSELLCRFRTCWQQNNNRKKRWLDQMIWANNDDKILFAQKHNGDRNWTVAPQKQKNTHTETRIHSYSGITMFDANRTEWTNWKNYNKTSTRTFTYNMRNQLYKYGLFIVIVCFIAYGRIKETRLIHSLNHTEHTIAEHIKRQIVYAGYGFVSPLNSLCHGLK